MARRESAARKRTCQVVGCKSDLSSSRYCWKRRCCAAHLRAQAVTVAGSTGLMRFCQQCGKFEALSSFLGDRRSCTAALEKRRRLEHAKHAGSPSSSTLSLGPSMRRGNAGPTAPLSAKVPDDTRSDTDDAPQLPSTPDCCASGQQRDGLQPRPQQQEQQSPGQQALPAAPSASADDTVTAAVMDRDQQLREMVALAEDDEAEAIDMELELLLQQAMREAAAHSAAAPDPAVEAAPPVAGASAVLLPAEASPAAAILPTMGPPASRTATHKQQQQQQGGGGTVGHPAAGWVAASPGALPAAAPRLNPEAFEARLAWLQEEYVQLQAHLMELHATLRLLMQS